MDVVTDIVSWIALLGGGVFAMIGGLGVLRLPDVFARMHGAGITDTLGAGLILTSPTATYALANAAMSAGLRPLTHKKEGPSS